MKLSELERTLKLNLPRWKVEIDETTITFSIISWSTESYLHFSDLEYIKNYFKLHELTIRNNIREWERNNSGIDHTIDITHNIKFEKEEEWEDYDE
jgi:hypothetical protein